MRVSWCGWCPSRRRRWPQTRSTPTGGARLLRPRLRRRRSREIPPRFLRLRPCCCRLQRPAQAGCSQSCSNSSSAKLTWRGKGKKQGEFKNNASFSVHDIMYRNVHNKWQGRCRRRLSALWCRLPPPAACMQESAFSHSNQTTTEDPKGEKGRRGFRQNKFRKVTLVCDQGGEEGNLELRTQQQ